LVNQLDFYPTILDLTDTKIPTKYKSDLDGLNISNVLLNTKNVIKDEKGVERKDLWWHFPHNREHQMQSAIRAGDYKLYKNHTKGNYELYRLYKDGERADLEEKFDIAEQSPEVLKDLSTRLEKYLKEYDAKFPYKNPLKTKGEPENVAAIPQIKTDSFDPSSRKITVTLEKGNSKVIEFYGLISYKDLHAVKKNGKKRKVHEPFTKLEGEFNKKKSEYTLTLPVGVTEAGIIFIDENRFMVKSKFHALNGSNKVKKNKKKKRSKKN
jgi:hypothetical protein